MLKLLARVCDGQHSGLQDYLREQPDNVKSFNIVGETAQFLNVVYTTINSTTIDLVIQLFSTLNEFCSGNQENRVVVYDMKVIDYINFILRAGEISDCCIEKAVELQQIISCLILSLTEENGPGASQVAKEVKDALDKEAVYRSMTACYEWQQSDKKENAASLGLGGGYLQSAKSIAAFGGSLIQGVVKGKKRNALQASVVDVGFSFYMILARMFDIDPHLGDNLHLEPENIKAFEYYRKNCLSIEIVKDDILQKVNFRVKNKSVLREEVKEKLKWNVDRTSPSNKIRDLMDWTKDVMRDISYQRKILDHTISKFFTKGWLLWNYGTIFLSLAINVIMLVTWNAKASLEDCDQDKLENSFGNASKICPDLYDPIPDVQSFPYDEYRITMWVLSGVHNLFSLFVVISYFLSYHPRLPRMSEMKTWLLHICGKKRSDNDLDEVKEDEPRSKLNTRFFSFTTFYYLMFLGMSVAGTYFDGYFFAFHLLNIVNNNQLLGGVIKAVTQNGMSLLWVAVLGFVVIYIYALVGFSLLRAHFSKGNYLYCSTLWECTVTVIRYGLIGDMFEEIKENPAGSSFSSFWPLVIYHVSFFIFITTIGLNIIFGIIVDTFSELRDLKWRAESDMKDTCFICSRNSYDFEHHGKGFEYHVKKEHNMWAYVYFILHLDDIKASDYNALELYVAKLMEKENYDFIPLNQALCLSSVDIDSTESKIDELLCQVNNIAKKQKEEEAEKKRKMEKLKQKRWQEKHRGLVLANGHGDYDSDHDMLNSREPSVARSTRGSVASRDTFPPKRGRPIAKPSVLSSFSTSKEREEEDIREGATPSPLTLRVKQASTLDLQRQQEDDDELRDDDDDSIMTDSDAEAYPRLGSYNLLDTNVESSVPSMPPAPTTPPPPPPPPPQVSSDESAPSFPAPPLFSPPPIMLSPASDPPSPRSPDDAIFTIDAPGEDSSRTSP